jgi:hypothetical protein
VAAGGVVEVSGPSNQPVVQPMMTRTTTTTATAHHRRLS